MKPITMSEFYTVKFSNRSIDHIKDVTDKKNKALNYNNWNKRFDTRWVGTCGELAFKRWLDRKEIVYDYHADDVGIDEFDFTLYGKLPITVDVKTVSTKYYPKRNYACNVDVKQYNKLMRKGTTDLLVFSRFMTNTNEALLVGWIAFKEFINVCVLEKKGTVLNSKMTASTDSYKCKISDLHRLSSTFVSDYKTEIGKVYSI